MRARSQLRFALVLLAASVVTDSICAQTTNSSSRYEIRKDHDRDGIGKFYMGREIAQVMGHQAADWLERPEREDEERPDLTIPALKLRKGDAVTDSAAGTGYYSRRLAQAVGTNGVAYAVEI